MAKLQNMTTRVSELLDWSKGIPEDTEDFTSALVNLCVQKKLITYDEARDYIEESLQYLESYNRNKQVIVSFHL